MERTLENGAQATATKEASAYGTITDIVTIKRSRCAELIGDGSKEKWFKAKVNYITIDEKTGKEKKTPSYFFVNAETIADAKKAVDDFFGATMIDYSIATLDETKVIDVFRHDLNTNNED